MNTRRYTGCLSGARAFYRIRPFSSNWPHNCDEPAVWDWYEPSKRVAFAWITRGRGLGFEMYCFHPEDSVAVYPRNFRSHNILMTERVNPCFEMWVMFESVYKTA